MKTNVNMELKYDTKAIPYLHLFSPYAIQKFSKIFKSILKFRFSFRIAKWSICGNLVNRLKIAGSTHMSKYFFDSTRIYFVNVKLMIDRLMNR